MSSLINCGEASDYVKAYRERFKKAPMIEITKNLLFEKLSLKSEKYFTETDDLIFKKFLKVSSARVTSLIEKVRYKHAYERGHISRTDILIDIEVDCPELIQSDSQTLSQTSTASNMSTSQTRKI